MSQLQAELLKILIDKGLLAIALMCVGFYLSKAIEKYKANNTYFQKVSEARIQAYRDISRELSSGYFQIQDINHLLASYVNSIDSSQDRKKVLTKLQSAILKQRDSLAESRVVLSANQLFYTPELLAAVTNYLNMSSSASEVLLKLPLPLLSDSSEIDGYFKLMAESEKKLSSAFADLHLKLQDEIKTSPFS